MKEALQDKNKYVFESNGCKTFSTKQYKPTCTGKGQSGDSEEIKVQ